MYTIYEIPSKKKIGVTDNYERRFKQHIKKYCLSPKEIIKLEDHTDIYEVSDREQELQRGKGYRVDKNPYWYVIQVIQPKCTTPQARKKSVAKKDYKGERRHLQRGVVSISPDGTEAWYSGMAEASRQLTKKTGIIFHQASISNVCSPNCLDKSHRKYTFKYA